jgi:sulfatase maturation enzyme AslB (radical SAM superfamily)
MSETRTIERQPHGAPAVLDFLWLELTNRCNLACKHCYAESGPDAGHVDAVGTGMFRELVHQAHGLGCRQIQFIGGEPTLYPALPCLIEEARKVGFTYIEVFTNLIRLPQELLTLFKDNGVSVGTSVYGPCAETHEKVTLRHGSFDYTVGNIRRLISAGIQVRAGLIEMHDNRGVYEETRDFLLSLGVHHVGKDRLRHFGRGKGESDRDADLSELCGSCSGKTLCVGSNGEVTPCIMSRQWSIGSVLCSSLTELATAPQIAALRTRIHDATLAGRCEDGETLSMQCDPAKPCFPCGPDASCNPCTPNVACGPNQCRPYCVPNPSIETAAMSRSISSREASRA